jgi:(1->4)-alpha-D-glucan 1-alpha-D-glucosylmutase
VVAEADRDEIGRANVTEALRRILLLDEPGNEDFVVRFQQTTGPVMAKGVEDTAFYRYFRLAALNEVGGNPGRFGVAVDDFHDANEKRAARFPRHLLTTYTHDTKRSPDVRARIVALTWLAEEWSERVHAWRRELGPLDDPREELLVLQTLAGAAPIERERLDGYLQKALREGKVNTNWLSPNEHHERRVQEWAARAAALLERDPFLERVREVGRRLAVAQLFLKLTCPGVADLYRGDELEDLSLVDPDNRRPVDWEARRSALAALVGGAPPDARTLKLYVTWRTLRFRAEHEDAFAGAYERVSLGNGVCAFTRGGAVLAAAAVDPSVTPRAPDGWRDVLGVDGLLLCVPS